MAAKMNDFSKSRGNTKRNVEPMYTRSKYITMSNGISDYNTKSYLPSAWKASHDERTDDKLFLERRDLIGQWFNTWNDIQRKRFFDFILDRSAHSQLKFILGWFKKPIRSQQDFVTVLPRVVSTHVFSYLDPRSLCRAARVSWHWKWLVEQDIIWKSKCLKFGWYLPYKPSALENGAWKKHYVMCIQTLSIELPKKSTHLQQDIYHANVRGRRTNIGEIRNIQKAYKKWKKTVPLIHKDGEKSVTLFWNVKEPLRPPWVANSFRPKELELADNAFFRKTKQNKPSVERTMNKHTRSKTTPEQLMSRLDEQDQKSLQRSKSEELSFPCTTTSSELRDKKQGARNGNDFTFSTEHNDNPSKMTLSETIRSEMLHQTDGMELGDSTEGDGFCRSFKQQRLDSSKVYTTCESMRSLQDFSLAYPNMVNPRVVFISSKIPALELLVNALVYGVLPIVYPYEGTTLCGLLEFFTSVLQGRKARSVGFFVSGQSESIDLVRGNSVSLSTLHERSEMQKFWQALCMEILSNDEGGHVDIFYPLGGTDAGMELLGQLQILTGLTFSSPAGTLSSILKVDDDWLPVSEDTPSKIYFNEMKLIAWARTAEYIEESMVEVRGDVYGRFDGELHGLATKVIGQIMFSAFGLLEISEMQDISKVLVKALVLMTRRKDVDKLNPTTCFIQCLQECRKDRKPKKKRAKKGNGRAPLEEKEPADREKSDPDEELDSDESSLEPDNHLMNSNLSERVTLGERRSVLAHEILSSERDYCNTLGIIQNVFRKPLEASIKSNRQVIGAPNIRMIFNDSETLLVMSKELTDDLSSRLHEWDSHQCLGDVFLKFNTKLKAYMNFLNNYPITLATIEKCQKQHPAFHGFLLQLEKQPSTRLMSLPTLLLAPTKRIQEYVCLLEAFLHHTPVEHKDHKKLKKAIEQLKQLKSLFDEASTRLRRERSLKEVQKRIDNCPALVERGRFFLKQEDAIHLKQADDGSDVKPEFRVYQNIGNLGLFLFNDCVVVTTKMLMYVPFQRILDASYKYHSSLPLSTVKLEEIADSKYIQNAFIITTNKRQWICQAKSSGAKVNWLSLLNSCKRTTLNENYHPLMHRLVCPSEGTRPMGYDM